MKIIIGGFAMNPPITGIGVYAKRLFQGLAKNDRISDLICIPKNYPTKVRILKKNFFSVANKIIKSLPGTYAIANKFRDFKFKKKSCYLSEKKFIYHEPSYILRPYSGPKLCTVHDLSHIHYPHYHPRERVRFLSKHLAESIKNSQHVITGSNFVRNEIINFFNVAPNKISTIYHGVDKIYRPYTKKDIALTLSHYQLLDKKYLLYVGTLEPRKNLKCLIEAFNLLPRQLRKQYSLVLVGYNGWSNCKVEKMINKFRKEGIYYLGYVTNSDLPYLYAGATAFLYLSIYEGFGLPVLEALASGVPCITSNTSSIPEVLGNAGLLVNPFDVASIAKKISQLLNDTNLQKEFKRKGIIHAAKFSWDTTIDNTIKVYESILAST